MLNCAVAERCAKWFCIGEMCQNGAVVERCAKWCCIGEMCRIV